MIEQTARLVLPARPEYLRFARITVASLATRLGFSYDDLEDLRLAVDEICFALLPGSAPTAGGASSAGAEVSVPGPAEALLELRYLTTSTGIQVEGALRDGPNTPVVLSELGKRILAAVVDEYEVCPDTGRGETIWIRKSGPEGTDVRGLRA